MRLITPDINIVVVVTLVHDVQRIDETDNRFIIFRD